MGWNPFKKDEQEDNQLENNSLELKVNEALQKAKTERKEAEREISNIRSWAAEAIVDTYAHVFPNGHLTYYREQYKDKALATFDQIKAENADKVAPEKAEQCSKIVAGYMAQIGLRESKLKLYDKLIVEYEATKLKLKGLDRQKASNDNLSKHQERLGKLDSDSGIYVDAVSDADKLKELQREFEMKSEYMTQLDQLAGKYGSQTTDNFDTSDAFKSELDDIIKGIN
jgi:hypothetical protein